MAVALAARFSQHRSYALLVVWSLASVRIDQGAPLVLGRPRAHIPVFLLQGCVTGLGCGVGRRAVALALRRVAGRVSAACGLIPWAASSKEFHNAAWHAFVLLGSACMFQTIFYEVVPQRV